MNTIFYINDDNPHQPVTKPGLVVDGYDPVGIDDSLPLNLDDTDRIRQIEYRCHKRFQLIADAFAAIRSIHTGSLKIYGKSMGSIACAVFRARPARLGKIDNISMGGLMFNHVDSQAPLNQALVLDILLADCGFYLAGIPFKIIADVVIPDEIPGDVIAMRQVRLQFQKLNAIQKAKLEEFIMNYGAEFE